MIIVHKIQFMLISQDNYFVINICAIFYVVYLIQPATTDHENYAN